MRAKQFDQWCFAVHIELQHFHTSDINCPTQTAAAEPYNLAYFCQAYCWFMWPKDGEWDTLLCYRIANAGLCYVLYSGCTSALMSEKA